MKKYIILSSIIGLFFISCKSGPDTALYDVTVSATPAEGGTISPTEDSTYEEGSTVTLRATASDVYTFSEWSGDISSAENPLRLTVDQDYNVMASFVKKEYELTVNKTGEGMVQERVVQTKSYEHGTVVELSADPETGYEFVEWTGDLNSTDNPKTIVMDRAKTVTAHFDVKPSKAAIKIKVDWTSLEQFISQSKRKGLSDSVTHFGARLVYPAQNAVFQQSVEKVRADSMGVITMEVPAADTARLLVAAVQYQDGNNNLLGMGVLEGITIRQGKGYEWGVDDLSWTKPFWKPADSLANDYESGTFSVSKDKESFTFYFLVRDSYYPFPDPDLNNYLIRLNGRGGNSGYQNGFRIMRQIVDNPTVGIANEATYNNFYPYLKSELFQLPSNGPRYVVYQKGSFTVSWQ